MHKYKIRIGLGDSTHRFGDLDDVVVVSRRRKKNLLQESKACFVDGPASSDSLARHGNANRYSVFSCELAGHSPTRHNPSHVLCVAAQRQRAKDVPVPVPAVILCVPNVTSSATLSATSECAADNHSFTCSRSSTVDRDRPKHAATINIVILRPDCHCNG